MRQLLIALLGLVFLAQNVSAGSVVLLPTGSGTQRWLDTVDNPYSAAAGSSHADSFYSQAAVTVTYADVGESFAGRLQATGLKPHFAYQMKLDGAVILANLPDDASRASEALGYAGRWWLTKIVKRTGLVKSAWNSTDTEYETYKAIGFQDRTYRYEFNGYLMFDYFVTDRLGTIDLEFFLDSSFHVLWKSGQSMPEQSVPVGTYQIDPDTTAADIMGNAWYDIDFGPAEVTIYGEIEHEDQEWNDEVGETVLPNGTYPVSFMLTEESFHSGLDDGGSWAGVLSEEVSFVVGTPPVNHAPVAVNDSYEVSAGVGGISVAPGVLANDTDPDGDALAAIIVEPPAIGSVSLNPTGSFTYNVDGGFQVGETYSFTYRATDGELWSEVATVTLVPTYVPPPPTGLVVTEYTLSKAAAGVNTYAVASIALTDDGGTAAAGATVTFTWVVGGKTTTQVALTDAAGGVTFTSPKTKKPGLIWGEITGATLGEVTSLDDSGVVNPQSVTVP